MAGEAYDYIMAFVIMGLIFVSAVMVAPNLSYVNLLYVDQQQLRNVAQETLKTMLLDSGYPGNWGSAEEQLQRFGLASSAGNSFYTLDPQKVQRLDIVGYDEVRDLLGLEDYGFSLRVLPPFNVTIPDRHFSFTDQEVSIYLRVEVSRHDERPLANAAVHPTIVYTVEDEATENVDVVTVTAQTVFTDLLGRCEVDETLTTDGSDVYIKDVVAILKVTVADIATVVDVYYSITGAEEVIEIDYGTNDTVALTIPLNEEFPFEQPNEADWVCNVAGYYGPGDMSDMYSGGKKNTDKITSGEGYKSWNRTLPGIQSSDPAFVIFAISCVPKHRGRTPLLIVSPGPNYIEPEGLHFGGNSPQGTTVCVQRNVMISKAQYLIEMTLWNESP